MAGRMNYSWSSVRPVLKISTTNYLTELIFSSRWRISNFKILLSARAEVKRWSTVILIARPGKSLKLISEIVQSKIETLTTTGQIYLKLITGRVLGE